MLSIIIALVSVQDFELQTIVDRVQSYYDNLEGFEANFIQRYEHRLLNKVIEEKGKVIVKKPGRFRWEYTTPEKKLFITDSNRSYFYIPKENQVFVSHKLQGAMGMSKGSPFEVFAGTAQMTDSFTFFSSTQDPTLGGIVLDLIPTTNQEDFEKVEIEVDPKTGALLRIVLVDFSRNRTEFRFKNILKNLNLAEALFHFVVPSGVDVILQSDTAQNGQ